MIITMPNVVHIPGPTVNMPDWDTLFGLHNRDTVDVVARFRFFHENSGLPVMWPSGLPHEDVILKAGLAFAATLIPGNGFVAPPQNFVGRATIECLKQMPFGGPVSADLVTGWSMWSGENWDNVSPSIEGYMLRPNNSQTMLHPNVPASKWLFPYVIPNYENADHPGPKAYRTGINVQNISAHPTAVVFRYVINQCYGQMGQAWTWSRSIPAGHGIRFHLDEDLFPLGYPSSLNSEGHLEMSTPEPTLLLPTAIIATRDYVFSAGQLAQVVG